jgi:RNA polymerase sigma-70 factor (ECF subfamily)
LEIPATVFYISGEIVAVFAALSSGERQLLLLQVQQMQATGVNFAMKASVEVDLVSRIMAGDRGAEEEFVRHYSRGVTLIIRHESSNPEAIDDLCQETFRIALQKIRRGDVREPEKIAFFIRSVAKNLVIMEGRKGWREESLDVSEGVDRIPAQPPDQLDELQRKELAVIVRRVLDQLKSERDREVLFRYYILEEDKQKICSDFRLSSLHFNRVLCRARDRFKELYKLAA